MLCLVLNAKSCTKYESIGDRSDPCNAMQASETPIKHDFKATDTHIKRKIAVCYVGLVHIIGVSLPSCSNLP